MKWFNLLRGFIMNALDRRAVRREFEVVMRQGIFEVGLVRLDLSEPSIGEDDDHQQKKLMEIHERMLHALAKLDNTPDDSATKDSIWKRCVCFVKDVLGVHGGGTGDNLAAKRTGLAAVLAAIGAFIAWVLEWI